MQLQTSVAGLSQAAPLSSTATPFLQSGALGEVLVSELHGKYYQWAKAGLLFHGVIATASAIPVTSTTSPTSLLWNPAGSGKNLVLIRYAAGWAATTEAPGNLQLAVQTGVGSAVGTAAPFSAVTTATPLNALLGASGTSPAIFGTAATATNAATSFYPLGLSHLTTTGTATFGSFAYIYDFDGMVIVPPGVAVYDVASTATASTYSRVFSWYVAPV